MAETRAAGTIIARTGGRNAGSIRVHRGGTVPEGYRVSSANRAAGIVGRSKNRTRDLARANFGGANGRGGTAPSRARRTGR